MRIVADENVADAIVNAIDSAGHDLELVRDTYETGAADPEIEARANDDDRAVLTPSVDMTEQELSENKALYSNIN